MEYADWITWVQRTVVGCCEHISELSKYIKNAKKDPALSSWYCKKAKWIVWKMLLFKNCSFVLFIEIIYK